MFRAPDGRDDCLARHERIRPTTPVPARGRLGSVNTLTLTGRLTAEGAPGLAGKRHHGRKSRYDLYEFSESESEINRDGCKNPREESIASKGTCKSFLTSCVAYVDVSIRILTIF